MGVIVIASSGTGVVGSDIAVPDGGVWSIGVGIDVARSGVDAGSTTSPAGVGVGMAEADGSVASSEHATSASSAIATMRFRGTSAPSGKIASMGGALPGADGMLSCNQFYQDPHRAIDVGCSRISGASIAVENDPSCGSAALLLRRRHDPLAGMIIQYWRGNGVNTMLTLMEV